MMHVTGASLITIVTSIHDLIRVITASVFTYILITTLKGEPLISEEVHCTLGWPGE